MTKYTFTNSWFESTAEPYWPSLKQYLNNSFGENLNCLDVGTYEGRSAVWMAENLVGSSGSVHLVDPLKGPYKEILLENIEAVPNKERVLLHALDSVIAMPKLFEEYGEHFHFVYIDAGKSASDNCLNALIGERLLVKGGLLVIDDYLWSRGDADLRRCPKLGVDLYSSLTLLTSMQNTPRTQAVFKKEFDNQALLLVND